MYYEKLIEECDNEFRENTSEYKCDECDNDCKGSCKDCLEDMHYGTKRKYNCNNLVNCYVCKYIFKYSSEIEILIRECDWINQLSDYNIISIGCGPCTDLFGFINYIEKTEEIKPVKYWGIDHSYNWIIVHEKLKKIVTGNNIRFRFLYHDVFKFIDKLNLDNYKWRPNILIFQYVISDFVKVKTIQDVNTFIDQVINYILKYMPSGSLVIFNDINHNTKARDYFEYFSSKISHHRKINIERYHFHNNNKPNNYWHYGTQHSNNDTTIEIPEEVILQYSPWQFCSSAQLVLKMR